MPVILVLQRSTQQAALDHRIDGLGNNTWTMEVVDALEVEQMGIECCIMQDNDMIEI